MLRRNGGRIINISSAAAIFSIPFQAFYSASKAAINSLTLALRNELRDFSISVCAVMPGDVKTGFTKRCGRCLVTAAERNGLCLISVTLNAPNDWSDHTNMLDYGFNSYVSINLAEQNTYRLVLPVTGGNDNVLVCTNTKAIKALLPVSHGEIICRVEAPRFVLAPISAGDHIGKIGYYCDGKLIGESPLIAVSTINSITPKNGFWSFILRLLGLNSK